MGSSPTVRTTKFQNRLRMMKNVTTIRKPTILLFSCHEEDVMKNFFKANLRADLIGQWTENDDEIQILKNRLDGERRLVDKETFDNISNEIYALFFTPPLQV